MRITNQGFSQRNLEVSKFTRVPWGLRLPMPPTFRGHSDLNDSRVCRAATGTARSSRTGKGVARLIGGLLISCRVVELALTGAIKEALPLVTVEDENAPRGVSRHPHQHPITMGPAGWPSGRQCGRRGWKGDLERAVSLAGTLPRLFLGIDTEVRRRRFAHASTCQVHDILKELARRYGHVCWPPRSTAIGTLRYRQAARLPRPTCRYR